MNVNVDFYDPVFLEKLRALHIVTNKLFHGRLRGKRRSMKKGSSIEFAEFRRYTPGDDFRFIDWNIMARLQKVMIRSFWDEENISVHLLIDTSSSMRFGTPSKLQYAKKVAACLASVALANHDSAGLATFSDRPTKLLAAKCGTSQLNQCFSALQDITPDGETNIEAVIKRVLATGCDKGIVILLSDMLDTHGYETPCIYALSHGFEIHVIHIDAQSDLETEGTTARLTDSETGRQLDVSFDEPLAALLKREQRAFQNELQRFCHSKKIPYFYTDTSIPFDEFVLHYFKTLLHTQ